MTLGKSALWLRQSLKGLTAEGCLLTTLRAAGVTIFHQGRNSGLHISVCVTQAAGRERDRGGSAPRERVIKEGLSGWV